jgi:cytochrome c-type biogenesis protein CcmH
MVSAGAGNALPPDVQRRVARLAERLRDAPNDADGWLMMGRSYVALGRYRDAAIAYSRAAALRPGDANVAADHADVAAMAQGRRFAGEPARLIDHTLAIDPNHLKALALAGTAAMELRDYRAAADYWSRFLARVPADSPAAANARASLAQAQALAGEGRP